MNAGELIGGVFFIVVGSLIALGLFIALCVVIGDAIWRWYSGRN